MRANIFLGGIAPWLMIPRGERADRIGRPNHLAASLACQDSAGDLRKVPALGHFAPQFFHQLSLRGIGGKILQLVGIFSHIIKQIGID